MKMPPMPGCSRGGPCLSSSLIASSGDESAKKQNWVIWQRVSGHIRVQPCGKRKQMQSQSADDELACKNEVGGERGITNYILIEVAAAVEAAEAMTNSQNWRRTPIRTRSTHNAHTEDVSVVPPSPPRGMLRILSRQQHRSLFNVKSGRSLLL